jgi:hypothetical protein
MRKSPFDITATGEGEAGRREADYDEFEATELYCPNCSQAVPVRKSLLLVLPEGEKYEYCCKYCGGTVGDKIDRSRPLGGVLKT